MNAFYGRTIFIVSDEVINHMNATNYEDVTFCLNFTSNLSRQTFVARIDLTRLQRAPEGAGQSTGSRGDDIVQRGCVGWKSVGWHFVMCSDGAMDSEYNGLRL